MTFVEILGIIADIIVIVSMFQKNEKRLRLINILGCGMFFVYGIMMSSISLCILNTVCIGVNIFRLVKGE